MPRWQRVRAIATGLMLALGSTLGLSAQAAERLTVTLGPLSQTVTVADLQHYATTGEVPESLALYRWLLNEQVQQALLSRAPLEPSVGKRLVNDILDSSAGDRLLQTLQAILPTSSRADLHTALSESASHDHGLTFLGFLHEYPQADVTLDLSAAFTLASEMNLPYWQSQALSSVLDRELTIPQSATFSNALDPTEEGSHWVRRQTLLLRDRDRHRSIPVDLYWTRRSRGPLIVISHGFGADRRFLGYLAHHLASHGFTVAALEHPGSNVTWLSAVVSGRVLSNNFMNVLPATEFIDRPKDVSFLLSELSRLNQRSGYLQGKVNTNEAIVIGHSLGGYTALSLAGAELSLDNLRQFCGSPKQFGLSMADWLQCTAADLPSDVPDLRDRRVKRVIALNPLMGRLFDQDSLTQNVRIPTLVTTSTSDAITPAISQQLLPYTHLQGEERYLLTAIGATHLSVGDPENLNPAVSTNPFVRERGNDETVALRELVKGVTLAFVKQETPEADRYSQFLTAAYAQSLSSPDLKLRLNTDVSPNLSTWLERAAEPLNQMTLTPPAQPEQRRVLRVTYAGITVVLVGLPLLMFFLPGSIPLATVRFFRRGRGRSSLFDCDATDDRLEPDLLSAPSAKRPDDPDDLPDLVILAETQVLTEPQILTAAQILAEAQSLMETGIWAETRVEPPPETDSSIP